MNENIPIRIKQAMEKTEKIYNKFAWLGRLNPIPIPYHLQIKKNRLIKMGSFEWLCFAGILGAIIAIII
jgi:hypothetical protein